MHPHKVVNHPINIQNAFEAARDFRIRVGLSSKSGTFSAERTPEGLGMIGMNVCILNGLIGLRMFGARTLIFGTLGTFFVGLGPFVLHSDPDALL